MKDLDAYFSFFRIFFYPFSDAIHMAYVSLFCKTK